MRQGYRYHNEYTSGTEDLSGCFLYISYDGTFKLDSKSKHPKKIGFNATDWRTCIPIIFYKFAILESPVVQSDIRLKRTVLKSGKDV